jgi:hypothetical protein
MLFLPSEKHNPASVRRRERTVFCAARPVARAGDPYRQQRDQQAAIDHKSHSSPHSGAPPAAGHDRTVFVIDLAAAAVPPSAHRNRLAHVCNGGKSISRRL